MQQEKSGRNLRRTPRRVFEKPIGVLRNGQYRVLQALQLSEGGMLFSTPERFDNYDTLVLSLIVRGRECVVLTGSIIYTLLNDDGTFSIGVRFSGIKVEQRRTIRGYVSAKTEVEASVERLQ